MLIFGVFLLLLGEKKTAILISRITVSLASLVAPPYHRRCSVLHHSAWRAGQTIGKSLLGLEVRTPDGESVSYSQALLRCLAYGVSTLFFGIGFLWVALNPGKRGWHDLLAEYRGGQQNRE